ncbi:DUF2334 domain-containing protein [Deinococcus marmoris]|uniref:DUF2334 domain-containing protein n=1 Tax=Deinococcus marmoris TaxID=249408 RepID=A0A1U7NWU6_9DEIO|nr:DUF2334 domain-containing protein [Deinococcus marmoris]OLV17391.1 hypothetical protein BOO71_0008908 [Deinococcus marmoris]
MTLKAALPVSILSLSLILGACGSSPSSLGSTPQTGGTDPAPTQAQQAQPVGGDMTPLFGDHGMPAPYKDRIPAQPSDLWAPLPDQPVGTQSLRPQATDKTVRVYYSNPLPASSAYRDGGAFHAILMANLLGQYDNVKVIRAPISQYRSADARSSLRTFYIGTVFDEALPTAFMDDVKSGAPVTWLGYNIWKLGDMSALGLQYKSLHTALTPTDIAAAYNTVNYKGYNYKKFMGPQEMIEVSADPAKTQTLAVARDAAGDAIPYLVRSKNFYYVADNPFQYIHPTDRYLVMADSLKTMLGDTGTATCKKQAILRLEDISAINGPQGLSNTLDVISALKVPFAMTVIPESYYNGVSYPWTGNVQSLLEVYRAVIMGGLVIQHGTTHNYHGLRDPEGNSAEEWEFWDKENNKSLDKLNPKTTQQRIQQGRLTLLQLGLWPQMWTTPHYEADVSLYPAINKIYPKVIERRMYAADGIREGQFFPYPVRDVYGTLVVPENLGNIQPTYRSDAVLEAAEANKGLSCAYASVFVHPYLMADNYAGADKLTKASLTALITGIQAKGYTFVNPLNVTTRTLK